MSHKDSSIRKQKFLRMSMNGDFCAELHNFNLLETMIQCQKFIKLKLNSTVDVAVLSRFNMKLQRWQALSAPILYKHAVASSRSASAASFNLIQTSRNRKREQQQGALTTRSTINARKPHERWQGDTSMEFSTWSIEI